MCVEEVVLAWVTLLCMKSYMAWKYLYALLGDLMIVRKDMLTWFLCVCVCVCVCVHVHTHTLTRVCVCVCVCVRACTHVCDKQNVCCVVEWKT